MNSRSLLAQGLALSGLLVCGLETGTTLAQCQLLVRETFAPGLRPHGNGRLREAQIHSGLDGYWPQVPAGVQWKTANQSGVPTWAFAASSLDPLEVDPNDPYNGTAFGEPPAAAVLPFAAPQGVFTLSAEAVMPLGLSGAIYIGFTSTGVVQSNFAVDGTLWMSLDGMGNWSIHANGSVPVVSGQSAFPYSLDSGWGHVELTFDPALSVVSGRVGALVIPATPVVLSRPLAFVGMEAHEYWAVLNNLSVFSGSPLAATVSGTAAAGAGGGAVFTVATNAADPAAYYWLRDGAMLADGVEPGGAVISGARTGALSIANVSGGDAGEYRCVVANACSNVTSNAAVLVVGSGAAACSPADVCGVGGPPSGPDGLLTGDDFNAFVAAFAVGDLLADVVSIGGGLPADGLVTGDDFNAFIAAFAAGCP